MDDRGAVLEYECLTPASVAAAAEYFGLRFRSEGERRLAEVFRMDAKNTSRVFERDAEGKGRAASEALRNALNAGSVDHTSNCESAPSGSPPRSCRLNGPVHLGGFHDARCAPRSTHSKAISRANHGKCALYLESEPGRYRGMFSWGALNHLLEFGGLAYPRLCLIREGQEIPPEAYIRTVASGYPRPLVAELTSAFCDGAVIVIESIEELNEPISRMCEALEIPLQVPVRADLYASWRDRLGSELRSNDHEVIILQIEGKKPWKLYPPAGPVPDNRQPRPKSTGTAVWGGEAGPGALLYVRGGGGSAIRLRRRPACFWS